ncbi:MAG: hypothetical protein RLZZ305_1103 [Actinomycetota bacterium]
MTSRHPFLGHGEPLAFAHRGGTSAAPENTMAAFQDAVNLGYSHVETDVHVTSDGVLVAFHDDDLLRTCRVSGSIEDMSWDELSGLRVEGREPIPRLEEVMSAWPDLCVNLDCKTSAAEEPLLRYLATHDVLHRVCVGSFSDTRLTTFRERLGPDLCTSTGPREVARLVFAVGRSARARSTPALAAQVPVRQGPFPVVTSRFIRTCHDAGLAVHVWTVNDAVAMNALLDQGVDGIMSDETRILREVMLTRSLAQ